MDIQTQLAAFSPKDSAERAAKRQFLTDWKQHGAQLFSRDFPVHFTVSALILNPALDKALLVHHNLFKTWCWVGGHMESGEDFLQAVLREAQEETGITALPASGRILSLDILAVDAHTHHNKPVPAHTHYSVAFGLIAAEEQPLQNAPAENSDVCWISIKSLSDYCAEPHMLPIYEKLYSRIRTIVRRKKTALQNLPAALLPWYRENARDLPWRKDRDAYHVWLSEIMLQQTRVEAVRGYYARFLETLPTIQDLAAADEELVLKLWEGLGYYSRARNLQKAAKQIVAEYGGQFPAEYSNIRSLPGIGDYTAGAVSSICFDAPEPAVDGNVIRVISRLCEMYAPIEQLKKELIPLLRTVYPKDACGDFTQSLMELGATVCTPGENPKCSICPASKLCLAHQGGTTELLPRKTEKKPRKIEERTVFFLTCGDRLAVRRRPKTGLLAGLWELPNLAETLSLEAALQAAERFGVQPKDLSRSIQRVHIFTHIEWHMTCYYLECGKMSGDFIWATPAQLDSEIALPTAFRIFLPAELDK